MTAAALVLAAGRGERFGRDLPKAFVCVGGVPLILRSLRTLAGVPGISQVIPVVAAGDLGRYAALDRSPLGTVERARVAPPVPGGATRQDSVRAGLAALPESVEWVAVHDAARCLVTRDEVEAALVGARETGAAILARPVTETIKRVASGAILETPDRASLWAAQTPQVFRAELLREALEKATAEGFVGTDDAQLVERLGVSVRIVEGRASNLKLTHPADLGVAEAILAESDPDAGGGGRGR